MTCVHRWVIAPPAGPVSSAVCKLCGEERDFRNVAPDSGWPLTTSEKGREMAAARKKHQQLQLNKGERG